MALSYLTLVKRIHEVHVVQDVALGLVQLLHDAVVDRLELGLVRDNLIDQLVPLLLNLRPLPMQQFDV